MASLVFGGFRSTEFFNKKLEDSGGSTNLLVDGSVTPVEFTTTASIVNKKLYVSRINLVMQANSFATDGFMGGAALTNGLLFDIRDAEQNKILITQSDFIIKTTRDIFLYMGDNAHFAMDFGGIAETVVASFDFWRHGAELVVEEGETLQVSVRDNLAIAANAYFEIIVLGALID